MVVAQLRKVMALLVWGQRLPAVVVVEVLLGRRKIPVDEESADP